MKKFINIVFLFLAGTLLYGQDFTSFQPEQYDPDVNYGSFNFAQFQYFRGGHVSYPEGLEKAFEKGYRTAELRIGWQSTGRQSWQQLHNYPYYGLGIFGGALGESDVDSVLGSPSGVYFFYGEPLVRFGKFTLTADFGFGLSYDFNPYHVENNPANNIIGSRVNLYFNGNLIFYYAVDDRLDLSVGANFFHFSNGRSNTPQRGVNMGGFNIGAKYNFNGMQNYAKYRNPDIRLAAQPTYIKSPKPPLERYGELQFMGSIGTVQTEPGEAKNPDGTNDSTGVQKRYTTTTWSIDYAYLAARTLKVHSGFDIMYDASFENYHDDKIPSAVDFGGKFMLGYHVGFQYLIERIAFYYSLGWYLYKEAPQRGSWYMRAGGRIGLTEKLDVHLALKTRNGGIADWIEWGLAYKLKVHK